MIMQYLPTSYRGKVIADGTIYVPCGICLSEAIVNIFFPSIIITILLLKTQLTSNDPPWWWLWFRVGQREGRVWGQFNANLPGPSIEWLLQLINQGHRAPGFQNNVLYCEYRLPLEPLRSRLYSDHPALSIGLYATKDWNSHLWVCRTPGRTSWRQHHLRHVAHNLFW